MSLVKRLTYPLTKWLTHNRLSKLYRETAVNPDKIIPFGPNDKFILFSDCHRGDSSWKDDYAPNRNLHAHALSYYLQQGFTYIELGDGDELFEIKDFAAIAYAHRDTFYLMREFYCEPPTKSDNGQRQKSAVPKLYMLYGNHDIERRDPKVVAEQLDQFYIEYKAPEKRQQNMFPGIEVHESLLLQYEHEDIQKNLFLVHGHQGDWFNDHLWWLARIVVRHIWGPLQQTIGWRDPTLPAKPYHMDKWGVQQRIMAWAEQQKQAVICGHTHHSYFPRPDDDAYYFNTGSCVHPRAITGIEIQDGAVALVKWELAARRADGVLQIMRQVLVGPTPLAAYAKGGEDG